jgi:hypothetical protein
VHVGIVAVGLLPVAGARCFGGHRLLALAGIGSSYGPNVMFALSVEFPTAGSAFNTKTSISSVADLDVSGVGNTPFLAILIMPSATNTAGRDRPVISRPMPAPR